MLVIKDTIKSMNATLCDAQKYIDLAIKYKVDYPELANQYYNISMSHTDSYNNLHNFIVKLIEVYRRQKGEPPVAMQAVYDWEHEQETEKMKDIKTLQDIYKTM